MMAAVSILVTMAMVVVASSDEGAVASSVSGAFGPSVDSVESVHPDIAHLFSLYDSDHDGQITPLEAHAYWYATGLADSPATDGGALAAEIIAVDLDGDADGTVTLEEFSVFAERFLHTKGTGEGPHDPQQIHLALADPAAGPGAIRVTFVTVGESNASATAHVALGNGWTYSAVASHYTVPPRWWQPNGWVGWIYSAVLTDLQPGTRYNYTCVTQDGIVSASNRFTAPRVGAGGPVSFATFGDTGTAIPFGYKVTDKLAAEQAVNPVDFVLQQGDISYAGVDAGFAPLNMSKTDEIEAVWDLYGRQIEPVAASIPWLTGVGNHEAWYNFSSYRARYLMPQSPGSVGNFWYSFQYGNVHVCSASSEHNFYPGSPQYAWIDADLKAARANPSVDWIVFSLHRPLLSSDKSEYGAHSPGAPMLKALEPLLLAHGVDMTLTGHQHAYERVHPCVNGSVVTLPSMVNGVMQYVSPKAPVHLMIGCSGAMQEESWLEPAPVWSAKHFSNTLGQPLLNSYGYGRVDAVNATHLRFSFVPVAGDLADVWWIVK